MKILKYFSIATALTSVVFLSSCDKDEDMDPNDSLTVASQTLSQNMVSIESVTLDKDGWIVIHKDNGSNGPVVPDIVSMPTRVEAGTSTNVMVELTSDTSISDGDKIWVMLHTDDGVMGTYEFDGSNGLDAPLKDASGDVIMTSVNIYSASINASDQVLLNNKITISEVVASVDGWLVVHNDDGTGNVELSGIIGKTYVTAGTTTDVVVELDPGNIYTPGQKLFPMLHIDKAPLNAYNFPGVDAPEVFGFANNNIIVVGITVL